MTAVFAPRRLADVVPTPLSGRAADLRAHYADLDDAGIVALLDAILDPGVDSPFRPSEALSDALEPIAAAYRASYPLLAEPDPDEAFWNEADYRYDLARDMRA